MTFKNYLNEGIIVPKKLNIKTTNIKKLNKQFKDTILHFVYTKENEAPRGSYIPSENEIYIYVDKEMPLVVLEALIQHELIHLEQDKRSGGRMAQDIEKDFKILKDIEEYISSLDDDETIPEETIKLYQDTKIKMEHLNHEEEMTYSYMYVKIYSDESMNKVIERMKNDWKEWTGKSPTKKMMKYFGSYWMVKNEL